MTDLATIPAPGGVPVPVPTGALPGLEILEQWVTAAERAHALVAPLVKTAFVPDSFWPQPAGMDRKAWPNPKMSPKGESAEEYAARAEIAAAGGTSAVLLGMGVGVDPWTALANIHVVKSRPGMSSKLKVSLAKAAGHRIEETERTPEAVTVEGQRKGSAAVVTIRITIEEAKTAGWTSNDTYSKTPADMLYARAASRVVDRVCPEVCFGLASVEELATLDETPAPAAARVTVDDLAARAAAASPPPAVEAAAPVAQTSEPDAAVPMIDERTWKLILAEWTRLAVVGAGMKERRGRGLATLVGRPPGTGQLTAAEADVVLSTLQGLRPTEHREHLVRLCEILDEPVPAEAPAPDDVPPPSDEEIAAAERPAPAGAEPPGWDGLR
mgnify:CR=1 FL=1